MVYPYTTQRSDRLLQRLFEPKKVPVRFEGFSDLRNRRRGVCIHIPNYMIYGLFLRRGRFDSIFFPRCCGAYFIDNTPAKRVRNRGSSASNFRGTRYFIIHTYYMYLGSTRRFDPFLRFVFQSYILCIASRGGSKSRIRVSITYVYIYNICWTH